jgi:hypothetical protein
VIPSIAVLRIENARWHIPQLWIPLILLWIPLILILILLSPLILVVLLALSLFGGISAWRVITVVWDILSSLSGTNVHVTANGNKILVRIL